MKLFTDIPFLRIMIPFTTGVLVAMCLEFPEVNLFYFMVLLCLIVVTALYGNSKKIILLLADLFLFLFGVRLVHHTITARLETFYANYVTIDSAVTFIASVQDLPVEKTKTTACRLQLLHVKTDHGFQQVNGSLMAYFKRPVLPDQLTAGATLLIKAQLIETPQPKNPFEFNYNAYLRNKQIHHIAFIDAGAFSTVPVAGQLNAVWQLGLACKKTMMNHLKNSALSDNAYNICCALLTGYDDEIDKPVMEAFSHSGTLHVLSVSGLHTGLIYLVISFLFDLVDRKRRFRVLKFGLVTLILWVFALITGFSAPVLRAVIMFNLFGLGAIYFRNDSRNQLNILLVSAFILLCYNPFYIADVGFLLSYFALAGLICFQPKLSALWQTDNRLLNYIWQSVTASVAATVSTLPLTLFFFKQFPIWFFVCNLVVVPATFVVLMLAILVVLKLNVAALLINFLITWLITFINLFNSSRFGFIDNIHFVFTDVLCLSLLIMVISAAIHYRSYRLCVLGLTVIIAWQLISLVISGNIKRQTLFSVYQLKDNSVVSVKNKTQLCLSAMDSANYNFHIKPHVISFNYPDLKIRKINYVQKEDQAILILDTTGFWPVVNTDKITTLVLTNNFKMAAADLQRFKRLKMVVADGSNNSYTIKKTQELSRKFGLDFFSTKRQGAYLLVL